MSAHTKSSTSRHVLLGDGLAAIPESLLQAHAAGQVLFVVGAGVSRQAGLPDYRGLVLEVYRQTDPTVYHALCALGTGEEGPVAVSASKFRRFNLTPPQLAEVKGFAAMEYDVVLGMLERRIDSRANARSSVRQSIADELRRKAAAGPAPIHTALVRLADRGRARTIVTTNFDLLLEAAANGRRGAIQRRSLGDIPRPTYRPEFSGVLHIHGALDSDPSRTSDLVITDQDFGEYYLHRRVVPDLIYDAARLYSLVLVGYSANDPPMRYLLNAVAADSSHFVDLKDRYVFVPVNDDQEPDDTATEMARWKGRGITPIRYSQGTNHEVLCESLQRWAELSPINGEARHVEAEIRRIVQKGRDRASEAARDLFDHLIRRGTSVERQRLVAVASKSRADIGWLDAIHGALSGGGPMIGLDRNGRNPTDRETVDTSKTFLHRRLCEKATVNWAVRLSESEHAKCAAVIELVTGPGAVQLPEPWRSAWQMIVESWNARSAQKPSYSSYWVAERLKCGDDSQSLVDAVVAIVRPRVEVPAHRRPLSLGQEDRRRVRRMSDLIYLDLGSGTIDDRLISQLKKVTKPQLLRSLIVAVDAALTAGLETAARIGWDVRRGLGQLEHVCYQPGDPDRHSYGPVRGFVASIKLLHVAVSRLAEVDLPAAKDIVRRWSAIKTGLHLRLWACLSTDGRLTPGTDVGDILSTLSTDAFWDKYEYPEVSELRERRFGDMSEAQRKAVANRIKKLPPKTLFRHREMAEERETQRIRWAVRAFQRIESAGGVLPGPSKAWLDSQVEKFPRLKESDPAGRPRRLHAGRVSYQPDGRYDHLDGTELLNRLESALRNRDGAIDEDAVRAENWLRSPSNATRLIDDLEASPNAAQELSELWKWFQWLHTPTEAESGDARARDLPRECVRVLSLLARFSNETLQGMVGDVALWLRQWRKHVVTLPEGISFWLRTWPVAVASTNSMVSSNEPRDSEVTPPVEDAEAVTSDGLNTPVAKLVDVFLAACPTVAQEDRPFSISGVPTTMRHAICGATGRSAWIVRYGLLRELDYFLRADPDWAKEFLIEPLLRDVDTATALWHAVAQGAQSSQALCLFGQRMATVAAAPGLDRTTRESLVDNIILDTLGALFNRRSPSVSASHVQQMLRRLDDEVRDHAAWKLWQVAMQTLDEHSKTPTSPPVEDVLRLAISPFLREFWPQELSLVTTGVARSLAGLPALTGEAFAESVQAVERFLKPFDCWSMSAYGFLEENEGMPVIAGINDREKAEAFLRLLDLTIGDAERSVVPEDLANALEQIRKVAPFLADDGRFRRLSAACRRR